jgi:integrase
MYTSTSNRSAGLSVSSIMSYLKILRNIAGYSLKNEIEIRNIFYKEEEMKNYIKSLINRSQLTSFASLTYHLSELGRNITGYDILIDTNISLIHQKLTNTEPIEQHPVIPPRILSELIDGLNLFITDIYSYLSHIDEFIEAVTSCDNFARSNSLHVKKMIPLKDRPLNFKGAARKYELTELFVKYRVRNVSGLSRLISRIQHACRMYFHIYSGMRRSEVLSLKIDSLVERTMSFGPAFRFSGETSKLIGQRKKATWVTSKEVGNAYQIVNTIAKRIGSYAGITTKNTPLFISAGYLGLTATKNIDIENIKISSSGMKSQECYEYLYSSNFMISEEDLEFLYKIDSFKAWSESPEFKVGEKWRFTTHQLRRSLAYYISQSALVSLPTLKKQLKHLNREMTVYYCQSSLPEDDFSEGGHICTFLQKTKPDADAIAYLDQVALSDDSLYGCHGKFVEKNIAANDIEIYSQQNRNDLRKQFLYGEISYKETALGACTALSPCLKRAMREISGCLSCERAVIKPKKIENTINYQKEFVEDLKARDPDSIEYRSELAELNALIAYKVKFIDKDKSHDSN